MFFALPMLSGSMPKLNTEVESDRRTQNIGQLILLELPIFLLTLNKEPRSEDRGCSDNQ